MSDQHKPIPQSPAAHLLSADPEHEYSEEELDAIEALDAALALRIDRVQHLSRQTQIHMPSDEPVDRDVVEESIAEAKKILQFDGGDIELVGIEDRVVQVRLKGACVGCPNSASDLKNVVERLVRSRSPGVRQVVNVF